MRGIDCANSRTQKKFRSCPSWGESINRVQKDELKFFHDFFRNDPYRDIFMREIDCAHSRSVKMLP